MADQDPCYICRDSDGLLLRSGCFSASILIKNCDDHHLPITDRISYDAADGDSCGSLVLVYIENGCNCVFVGLCK